MQPDDETTARTVLADYALPSPVHLQCLVMGNINLTYKVVDANGHRTILQRLHPVFQPQVHYDIDSVTAHLRACGLTAPSLVRTRQGELWTVDAVGGVWRLQTFIEGTVFSSAPNKAVVRAAGVLLGRVHQALASFQTPLQGARVDVHNLQRHLGGLREALTVHGGHPAYAKVAPLAHEILEAAVTLPSHDMLPRRMVHGDPKLNNIVFTDDDHAQTMIDLDTFNRMPVFLELGDAWRSWCNPGGENGQDGKFSLPYFAAALEGYTAGAPNFLTAAEIAAMYDAVPCITLELAARFARDALEERYFGWDRHTYAHAWQHNIVRTLSQVALWRSYMGQYAEATAVIEKFLPAPL